MARLHMLCQRGWRIQMECFVLETDHHHFIVIDGGNKQDTEYFHGYMQALAGPRFHADLWLLTHAHSDHTDVLYEMQRNYSEDFSIGKLAYCFYPAEFVKPYAQDSARTIEEMEELMPSFENSGVTVVHPEAGDVFEIDGARVEILRVPNPALTEDIANNSSMPFRIDVNGKSVLILGDLGVQAGYEVIKNVPHEKLCADYIQMAHHGQKGANEDFYNACEFKACLWCAPVWLWNNDAGKGFNTADFATVTTRGWMEKRGITEHYVAMNGTQIIEL